MAETQTRAVLLILAIFLLGLISGGALFYLGQRSVAGPGPPHRVRGPGGPGGHPVDVMVERLQLDEEQRDRVHEILERQREAMRGLLEDSRREIHALLTEEQRAQFDELRPRMRRSRGPRH